MQSDHVPIDPPNVPLRGAFWSLLDDIWGFLKGQLGGAEASPELLIRGYQGPLGTASLGRPASFG